MGYPMTWQRVVNRNGLQDGDYGKAPTRHTARVNVDATEPLDPELFSAVPPEEREAAALNAAFSLGKFRVDRIVEYERAFAALAGDIRRLEDDATDERGICGHIAHRTGIDKEIVAAVLKEFVDF